MRSRVGAWPFRFALVLAIALLAANVVAAPAFGSPSNWSAELAAASPLILVAMASTPAIVAGGLDLSVGPLAVFCNVLLVHELFPHGWGSAWVAVALILLVGTAVGATNGMLVAVGRYQPVIATLCMSFVLIGLSSKLGATPQALPSGNWTTSLAGRIGFLPGALVVIGAPVLLWLVLGRSAYHSHLYAAGGNDVTAFSAGVDVRATRLVAYSLGGLFAAGGGLALTALVQSSQASSSSTFTLVGLAAVALGGTALGGGRGGLTGSVIGAVCIYLIQTLLPALNVPATWLNLAYGCVLLAAVVSAAVRTDVATLRWGVRVGRGPGASA